ncbi:hypothetical protein [Allorhizobium sonneratiae]|uniref:hypothetical protein n=1 Tax=Allorhizobium sonneratiae TaxID=2934936 RepID=UPI002034A3F6|nr:hypothetical protein [Allorhizobium sonneratiae]
MTENNGDTEHFVKLFSDEGDEIHVRVHPSRVTTEALPAQQALALALEALARMTATAGEGASEGGVGAQLQKGLEDSFPASDPVSSTITTTLAKDKS